jgi:hypothetical protein
VPGGFDVADQKIIDNMHANDLVITADIPLADAAINKNGVAPLCQGRVGQNHGKSY